MLNMYLSLFALSVLPALAHTEIPMLDPTAIDPNTNPCDDFYRYSCGGWIDHTELPADHVRLTRSFTVMAENTEEEMIGILENYSSSSQTEENARKLGNFYASCKSNEGLAQIEKDAPSVLQSIKAEINRLDSSKPVSPRLLAQLVASLHLQGVNVFFNFGSSSHPREATQSIGFVVASGIALGDKQYYLDDAESIVRKRDQYKAHLLNIFRLIGAPENNANAVFELEKKLAEHKLSRADARDPERTTNIKNLAELSALAPSFDWHTYFQALGIEESRLSTMNVEEPDFVSNLSTLLSTTTTETLKAYLLYQTVHSFASVLGHVIDDENFDYFGRKFAGQQERRPRDKWCYTTVSGGMGRALGEEFVSRHFPEESRAQTQTLIQSIRDSLSRDFDTLEWMDAPTVTAAKIKLDAIAEKIGYPDRPTDYSSLLISRSSFRDNLVSTREFSIRDDLSRVGVPVDRTRWQMDPHEVNAYYDPSFNEIVFPAGILLSPFFSPTAPMAANFGAIGLVMGHEISHGFDDQGSSYDAVGNLRDWWSPDVRARFEEKTSCLVNQYSTYTIDTGEHVNGQLTLGENIGDLGGMKLSYSAYQNYRDQHGPGPEVIGLNDQQQYFLSFAQAWCTKMKPEEQQRRIISDPHSPPKYRVNGVIVNTPEFAEAFGCAAGSPMAPTNRCQVW